MFRRVPLLLSSKQSPPRTAAKFGGALAPHSSVSAARPNAAWTVTNFSSPDAAKAPQGPRTFREFFGMLNFKYFLIWMFLWTWGAKYAIQFAKGFDAESDTRWNEKRRQMKDWQERQKISM